MPTTTRRRLLAMAAGIPAAFSLSTAQATPSPEDDAELVKAYAEFLAIDREYHFDPAGVEQKDEERKDLFRRWCATQDRVLQADVQSPNGLIIMALMGISNISEIVGGSVRQFGSCWA